MLLVRPIAVPLTSNLFSREIRALAMTKVRLSRWAPVGMPVVLAMLSRAGMVGALLADGVWDGVGAGLLGETIATIVWALARSRIRSRN